MPSDSVLVQILLPRTTLLAPSLRTVRPNIRVASAAIFKPKVRRGLSRLASARDAVECDEAVLSGTPCFKGTRIPVHDIADMLANGDSAGAIREAFSQLSESQIELAAFYARAYPRRGRPRREPFWRVREPAMTSEIALDDLPAPR